MTVSILWSNGVDFNQTFARNGVSKTIWELTTFNVPAALPLLAGSFVLMAYAVRETPGTQIWDSNGILADAVSAYWTEVPPVGAHTQTALITAGSPAKGGTQLSSGAAVLLPASVLSLGITLKIAGQFQDATEQIEGTAVACIISTDASASEVLQALNAAPPLPVSAITDTQANAPPVIGGSTFVTSSGPTQFAIDGAMGAVATVANSGAATAPSFANDARWADVISRANGPFGAAIGQYVDTIDTSTALPFNVSYSQGSGSLFTYELRRIIAATRRKSFAQVVG